MPVRPTDADLDRIVGAFDGLMHRLMATHAPEFNLLELTMSQTKALYLVVASGQLRMSELASRMGVTSSTATGVVDGLVSHGMLVRHEDPADRRQVVVTATTEAEATLQSFRELNANRMRQLLAHVAPRDLTAIERAIHVLDAAVTADEAAATIDPQGDRS
jgi:DNA-binding MarR family transcriptional regulator